jgi:hypothetical protein
MSGCDPQLFRPTTARIYYDRGRRRRPLAGGGLVVRTELSMAAGTKSHFGARRRFAWATAACLAVSTWTLAGQDRASDIKPSDGLRHARGELVAPVFEGWFRDDAGTLMLSFGYFNRNTEQELDIPTGPDNKIEPGPADQGQPTHFVPRRQWGAFAVPVVKEVEQRLRAEKKTVTWTLRANSQSVSIPANIGPAYAIDALKEPTVGNTPPVLRFDGAPASGTGPLGAKTSIKAVAGTPVTVKFLVVDDKRALPQKRNLGVKLTWVRYRGAGAVTITDATKSVDGNTAGSAESGINADASVTASFAEPGEYMLRVEAMDTEIHDFHCCWSNGYIHASVTGR